MRRQDGFSLIELLVVILIIGILATVGIPRFLGQREAAHGSEAVASLRSAQKALMTLALSNGGEMPALSGTDLTARLQEMEPGLKFENMTDHYRYDYEPDGSDDGKTVFVRVTITQNGNQSNVLAVFTPSRWTYVLRFSHHGPVTYASVNATNLVDRMRRAKGQSAQDTEADGETVSDTSS